MHIRDCAERILSYTEQAGADWTSQPVVLDAVCRNLEILGEAARKTEPEFRAAHPEIPWQSMIGVRNILIHAYEHVKPHLIRDIVESDIPALLSEVRRLLEEHGR